MKMFGSTYWDSLFGTDQADTIRGNAGGDLISGWYTGAGAADKVYGEAGNDMMNGFSVNLDSPAKSASRGASIDGGAGQDAAIIQVEASERIVLIARAAAAINVKNVEDMIYHFGSVAANQQIIGSSRSETVYFGESNANGRGMDGNDYLFSGSGDDTLNGGDGSDLLSAAGGHNILTGGQGADYFHFHITEDYQYSAITDFQRGVDKIAMFIDISAATLGAKRSYGDQLRTLGNPIDNLGYLDYDHGRYFDKSDFYSYDKLYDGQMIYEQKTGSLLQRMILEDAQGEDHEYQILIAHIDGNPNLSADDFKFIIM